MIRVFLGTVYGDPFFFQPVIQFVKGNGAVHAVPFAVLVHLVFFGDTGADKYHQGVRVLLLDELGVGVHGRDHRGQAGDAGGVILLHQPDDGMAAGADNHRHPRVHQLFVFPFDHIGADGGFSHVVNPQLFDGFRNGGQPRNLEGRHIGGRHAENDLFPFLEIALHHAGVVPDLFGVLRADAHTAPAEDAFVRNDLRLVLLKADGLNGALPDTFIAVFAVCFFKAQNFHSRFLPPLLCIFPKGPFYLF